MYANGTLSKAEGSSVYSIVATFLGIVQVKKGLCRANSFRLLIPQSFVIVRHWELAQQEIISSTSRPAIRALLACMTDA